MTVSSHIFSLGVGGAVVWGLLFGYSISSLYKNGYTPGVYRCVGDARGNWISSPCAGACESPSVWIWVSPDSSVNWLWRERILSLRVRFPTHFTSLQTQAPNHYTMTPFSKIALLSLGWEGMRQQWKHLDSRYPCPRRKGKKQQSQVAARKKGSLVANDWTTNDTLYIYKLQQLKMNSENFCINECITF